MKIIEHDCLTYIVEVRYNERVEKYTIRLDPIDIKWNWELNGREASIDVIKQVREKFMEQMNLSDCPMTITQTYESMFTVQQRIATFSNNGEMVYEFNEM